MHCISKAWTNYAGIEGKMQHTEFVLNKKRCVTTKRLQSSQWLFFCQLGQIQVR